MGNNIEKCEKGNVVVETSRIRIIKANSSHNEIIRKINETAEWGESIEFIESYSDNPYDVLISKGYDNEVILAENAESGEVIGFASFSIYHMYVHGKVERVAYINVVKIIEKYRKRFFVLPLMIKAIRILIEGRAELGFIDVYASDDELNSMYMKKRKSDLTFTRQIMCNCICFRPFSKRKKRLNKDIDIKRGWNERLREFYKHESPKMNLFPEVDDIEKKDDEWLYWEINSEIIGACRLFDFRDRHRYLMKKYNGLTKVLKWIPTRAFGYPDAPKEDEIVNNITMSMLLFSQKVSSTERADFMKKASSLVKGYDICICCVSENDITYNAMKYIKHVSFNSYIYTTGWDGEKDLSDIPIYVDEAIL